MAKKGSFEARSGRFGGCGDTLTSAASRRWLGWQTVGTRHIGDALDDTIERNQNQLFGDGHVQTRITLELTNRHAGSNSSYYH